MGRHAKPVTWNGVTYESVYDCAAAFDLSAAAVRWRLKRGIPLERRCTSARLLLSAARENRRRSLPGSAA